jgi:hypothetical protein
MFSGRRIYILGSLQVDSEPRLVQRGGTTYEMDTSRIGQREDTSGEDLTELLEARLAVDIIRQSHRATGATRLHACSLRGWHS